MEQLALNDVLIFTAESSVLFNEYYSDDALDNLGVIFASDGSLAEAIVPAGTKLQVYNLTCSENDRTEWSIWFRVLEWPPLLIDSKLRVVIPIDVLNILPVTTQRKPINIKLGQIEEEDKSVDDDDFSNIA